MLPPLSRIDTLRRARESAVIAFNRFLQEYPKDQSSVFCFFEARTDVVFFRPWIDRYFDSDNVKAIPCDGKDGVRYNRDKILSRNVDRSRVAFFMDKDIDDIALGLHEQSSEVFVTKFYSIENYLCTDEVLSRVLTDVVGLDENHPDFGELAVLFLSGQDQLKRKLVGTMAFVFWARANGVECNLSNVKARDLFRVSFEDGKAQVQSQRGRLALLRAACSAELAQGKPAFSELLAAGRLLQEQANYKQWLRGKWEAEYFIAFLRFVPEFLNRVRSKGDPRFVMHPPADARGFVTLLSPRCKIPRDVEMFLRSAATRDSTEVSADAERDSIL